MQLSRSFPAALAAALLAVVGVSAAQAAPVIVTETPDSYTLANGILTARVSKRDGRLNLLEYKGIQTIGVGYWSHSPASSNMACRVTIDPKTNSGQRGEVSIKGISGGNRMGSGPGGGVIADIEVRYALEDGASGLYTYSIFEHKPEYPDTSVGEARFCAKLNDSVFDWMTVDANRNMQMISTYDWNHGTVMNGKEMRLMNTGIYKGQVEHKYDYSANQFDVLAWGWSSTGKQVGFWFINPTDEYLSGGPYKVELSAHRDATFGTPPNDAPAPPCLLNYWRGSHYGGSVCNVAQGEQWTKVVGPFLIYCNSGPTPDAMWKDALAKSQKETAAWPCDWVQGVDYPHKDQRAVVSGKIALDDPQSSQKTFPKLFVGLAHPKEDRGGRGGAVDWQTDAKHYEFWTRGGQDGSFNLTQVRPGKYTLYAVADGVLGEFAKTDVTVEPGKPLALGQLDWKPIRYGKQLWDVGIPNRLGSEFFKGDQYFHWGWYLQYAKLFPQDVNYVVGKSDFRKDWFFEQVPHNENPSETTGAGNGRATPWTVSFNLPQPPRGRAILRLAICGVGARSIDVTVNNQLAGNVNGLVYNATLNRDGIGGTWVERDVTFDASLMRAGENTLKLTIPAGQLMSGIIYDYVRLELDENGGTPSAVKTASND